MDKNSPARVYGVLGYPAKHSLSPLMHNAAFRALNINAEYLIFEKTPQELSGFLHSLAKENIFGLNVTVPYKEKVIPFLNNLSDEAKLIGAVNTIKVSGDNLDGFNTDGEGFINHLSKDLKFNPTGKTVSLIGAGGASRAISVYLCQADPKSIAIFDIDKDKALGLVNHLKEDFPNIDFKLANSIEELKIPNCDLLINATPIGMKQSDAVLVEEKYLHKDLLVYDLIYNPAETKLLKTAKEKGARASNGLGMLLYQGARSFELWTDKPAPIEIIRQALNEGVKKI